MEGRGQQAFHYQEWVLGNVRPDPSQPPFLYAGKPTCFTGQSRALVFSGAGICKEEGLRSSVVFYSHLPKGGIDLGSSKTLLPPVLLQGRKAHVHLGAVVPSALSVLVLKAEPTLELSCRGPSTRQRCPSLSSCSTVQTTAGSLSRAASPGLAGWLQLASVPAGRVALLLLLEECKPPELRLRIGQEKSTNSNRKSKCPLQTCTRYEAIQHKEKNQMLDNEDYIMLWMNT